MFIFGSQARGEATSSSDVDFFLDKPGAISSLLERIGFRQDLEDYLWLLTIAMHNCFNILSDTQTKLPMLLLFGEKIKRFIWIITCTKIPVLWRCNVLEKMQKNLSEEFFSMESTLPWKKIIGLRNFFAHAYDSSSFNHEVIWNTIIKEVPIVRSTCANILQENNIELINFNRQAKPKSTKRTEKSQHSWQR